MFEYDMPKYPEELEAGYDVREMSTPRRCSGKLDQGEGLALLAPLQDDEEQCVYADPTRAILPIPSRKGHEAPPGPRHRKKKRRRKKQLVCTRSSVASSFDPPQTTEIPGFQVPVQLKTARLGQVAVNGPENAPRNLWRSESTAAGRPAFFLNEDEPPWRLNAEGAVVDEAETDVTPTGDAKVQVSGVLMYNGSETQTTDPTISPSDIAGDRASMSPLFYPLTYSSPLSSPARPIMRRSFCSNGNSSPHHSFTSLQPLSSASFSASPKLLFTLHKSSTNSPVVHHDATPSTVAGTPLAAEPPSKLLPREPANGRDPGLLLPIASRHSPSSQSVPGGNARESNEADFSPRSATFSSVFFHNASGCPYTFHRAYDLDDFIDLLRTSSRAAQVERSSSSRVRSAEDSPGNGPRPSDLRIQRRNSYGAASRAGERQMTVRDH